MASMMVTGKESIEPVLGIDTYTNVPISGPTEECTPVYRNKTSPHQLISSIRPDLDTYHKLFNYAADMYADKLCFGARKYDYAAKTSTPHFESQTYRQVNERKRNLGSGILWSLQNNPYLGDSQVHAKIKNHVNAYASYGVAKSAVENANAEFEKNTSFVLSIFSANRPEWTLTDLACGAFSITNTALYDNLGPDVTRYILELTRSPIVVCSCDKIALIVEFKQKYPVEMSDMIAVVSMDPLENVSAQLIEKAKAAKLMVHDIHQIEALGKSHRSDELAPSAHTLFTISFTSGTTGSKPKGAMLSHAAAVAGMAFLAKSLSHAGSKPHKAYIFLPLTHIYERQTSGFALIAGYHLGYPQLAIGIANPKDPFTVLLEDLRLFKPTYFSIVPRLITKLESYIKQSIKDLPVEEQTEVNRIIQYKTHHQSLRHGATGEHFVCDNYAPYKRLKALVGFENLRWTQSGSAPVSPSTMVYLKAALGVGIRQIYGMTETYAAITVSDAFENNPGSCGAVGATMELKLKQVESMGYLVKDGQGELLVRGNALFKGYYYNIEETRKMFDSEGWLYTGDIARIEPVKNQIYIMDRVKNFFKLAQGEYVSPEKVENRYLSSNSLISQLYVHGDSTSSYLVGIVGLDYEQGSRFLVENGFSMPSRQDYIDQINKPEVKRKLLGQLNSKVSDKLNRIEILHNVHVDINPLTVDSNVVTPTFKIKRAIAAKYFASIFTRLYEQEGSLFNGSKL